MSKREIRSFRQELRAETSEDGKTFLVGHTALYNSLSENLGTAARPWKERIMPGAFARAIAEKQDVRHLKNHDPNFVLGRTKAGTLTLIDDNVGLKYRTLLPDTSYARDLAASVDRGDIDEQSFGFVARKESWVVEDGVDIRQLEDLSLVDISTVTYPAYLGTSAGVEARMFPDGVPESITSHLKPPAAEPGATAGSTSQGDGAGQPVPANDKPKDTTDSPCLCECSSCTTGACSNCSNTTCEDPNCEDCPYQTDADASLTTPTDGQKAATALIRNATAMGTSQIQPRNAANANGTLEIYIYQDIGEDWWSGGGVTAQRIKEQIDGAGTHNNIRVRINSLGGDAFEGIAISNLLKAQGKPIEVCIDGIAASAASVIAMAGDTILMGSNTMMMVHNASSFAYGYASELRKTADVLDKISGSIAQTYVDRTGKKKNYIQGLMDAETWMSAADCVKDGFATAVTTTPDPAEEDAALAAALDLVKGAVRSSRLAQTYRNLPEQFKETRTAKDAEAEIRAKEIELEEAAAEDERERLRLRARAALAA